MQDQAASPFRAAVIQLCASEDIDADISRCQRLMLDAVQQGAELLTLPEMCVGFDQRGPRPETIARTEDQHPALPAFSHFAQHHKVEILIGSIGILEGEKTYNRSYLIGRDGSILASYDKIHLFDINLGNDTWFKESDTFIAGERPTLAPCMGGTAGMSICYDLRFPYLYRTYANAGAHMLFVPAAFTYPTGKAHWHTLLRARAIENGAWVIAPGQHGSNNKGCYGHSLIIDPWGTIQSECGEDEQVVVADIDLQLAEATRDKIPSLKHGRALEL